jgi:predicted transcriptional regulator
VLAVVAHAHGTSAGEIRRATGQLRLTLRFSLHELRRAALIELGAVRALHENPLRLEPLRSIDAVRARIANK